MKMLRFVLCAALFAQSYGFLFGSQHWNDLVVKWGVVGVSNNVFAQMPRTTQEAAREGWVPKVNFCSGTSSVFRGYQYWKGSDPAVILLFDRNGYIAGMQNGVPSAKYTPAAHAQNTSFVQYGDLWLLTVYFVKPYHTVSGVVQDFICNIGRTATDYGSQGTGSRFYIQNGTNPLSESQLINIPLAQADLNPNQNDGWNFGKCFYTVG